MLRKSFIVLIVLLITSFIISLSVQAEVLQPLSQSRQPTIAGSHPTYPIEPKNTHASNNMEPISVTLGTPGTNFSYLKTFGETEVAYISDNIHLNYPWGLSTDGTNVWIGEYWGNRALKYTQNGSFVSQIGLSGYPDIYDTWLYGITDVSVDQSGNTWLVDGDGSHIVEFDASGNKIRELGSSQGTGNDRFYNPQSIVFDAAGNIYVSDGAPWYDPGFGNHRIQIFDSAGNYLATIGQTGTCGVGNDRLCGPRHMALYGTQLYVSDAGNHRIQIYDISSPVSPTYVATIGVPGESGDDSAHFNTPSGVAVDINYIYVADLWNSRVQVINRLTRAYFTTIGTGWGSGNYQFKGPSDVAVDAYGYLYIADFVNTRVQQFSQAIGVFSLERTYGVTGEPYITDGAHYNHPSGVAVSTDGSIYLTEDFGHRLVKLDANGNLQWTVGAPGVKGDWDNSNDRLNNPADVALDANGKVYVADRYHGRVQIYTSDGLYDSTVGDLWCPGGVAIAPNNYLYVADSCQNTVNIYDTDLILVAMIGESGIRGEDSAHFNWPEDVAIDSNGLIYVADNSNQRVQVFDANRTYVRTIGQTGISGSNFDLFWGPSGLDVDGSDRLFVADTGNDRIQVFDSAGGYLTTIGGSWGNNISQVQAPNGVGVDQSGNVFIADWGNHRLEKFAASGHGWKQVNINGFGDRKNIRMMYLTAFGNNLYSGTANHITGGEVWRITDLDEWNQINLDGFGDISNVDALVSNVINGQLYVGTGNDNGAELWRCAQCDGMDWDRVVINGFGDVNNSSIDGVLVFSDTLYARTANWVTGGEIWASSSGDAGTWIQVNADGFGDDKNHGLWAIEEFNGYLYVGTFNTDTGGEIWRTNSGTNWEQVNQDGFGEEPANGGVQSFSILYGNIFAGTTNCDQGGQIWQSPNGIQWTKVMDAGFGDINNCTIDSLVVYQDYLYATTYNHPWISDYTGMEVWKSPDGTNWKQINKDGFGDGNNINGVGVIFRNTLFFGTFNDSNAGEVWQMMRETFLPNISGTTP